MNTLILTVSAGHGHNAAGEAITEYILKQEPDSRIRSVDTLKYISPMLDKIIIGTYLNTLKIYPKAFTLLYSTFNKKDESVLSIMDKVDELIADRLVPLLHETRPDVIISTHPFTSQMLSVLKVDYGVKIPALAIITDYGSHALWVHPGIDYYVVAHESIVPELVQVGRDPQTVMPFGIPIKATFHIPYDRSKTLAGIGLNAELPTVTLMGGSLALGHIKSILRELDSIPRDFNIVVIAAQNEKLYNEAVEISLKSDKSIAVLKFCHFMDALMQATDLLVTKPGGLTVTEALNTATPMAIFKAMDGQEEQNKQFLLKNDLAVDIGEGEDCAGIIESLLFHEDRLREMAERARSFAKPASVEKIYQLLQTMIQTARLSDEFAVLPEPQEGLNGKFKSLLEDVKTKLDSNKMTSALMELLRRHDKEEPDLDFYELSDEELAGLIDENQPEEPQSLP